MTIEFEKNAYLYAIKTHTKYSKNQIINLAKTTLRYDFATIDTNSFNQIYSKTGWIGRKISALPTALLLGFAKVVYHLAQAIFSPTNNFSINKNEYSNIKFFYIKRDLQESLGRFLCLFNDQMGCYYIQRSKFNKTCYDFFLANKVKNFEQKTILKTIPEWNVSDTLPNWTVKQSSKVIHTDLNKSSRPHSIVPVPSEKKVSSVPSQHDKFSIFSNEELDKKFEKVKQKSLFKLKDKQFIQLASTYLTKNNKEKALEVIKEVRNDYRAKEAFIVRIANDLYAEGDKEKALELIKEVKNDYKTREAFIVKAANDLYAKGDKEKALELIKEVKNDYKIREAFIVKAVDDLYARGDKERALELIKKVENDYRTKEAFIAEVTNDAHMKGDKVFALKAIELIRNDINMKVSFLVKLMLDYYNEKDESTTLKIMRMIGSELLRQELRAQDKLLTYTQIKLKYSSKRKPLNKLELFFNNLTMLCYEQSKKHFTNNSIDLILQEIKSIFVAEAAVNKFLELKKTEAEEKKDYEEKKQATIKKILVNPHFFSKLNHYQKNDSDILVTAISTCQSVEEVRKIVSSAGSDAKESEKVALTLVTRFPSEFALLGFEAKNNENVLAAAINGCKTIEEAKKLMNSAGFVAKKSEKVALALVPLFPSEFTLLGYKAKNNGKVLAAAIHSCTTSEEARKLVSSAGFDAKESEEAALALVTRFPSEFTLLGYEAKNNGKVLAAAIHSCTTSEEARKLVSSAGFDAKKSKEAVQALLRFNLPQFS